MSRASMNNNLEEKENMEIPGHQICKHAVLIISTPANVTL